MPLGQNGYVLLWLASVHHGPTGCAQAPEARGRQEHDAPKHQRRAGGKSILVSRYGEATEESYQTSATFRSFARVIQSAGFEHLVAVGLRSSRSWTRFFVPFLDSVLASAHRSEEDHERATRAPQLRSRPRPQGLPVQL